MFRTNAAMGSADRKCLAFCSLFFVAVPTIRGLHCILDMKHASHENAAHKAQRCAEQLPLGRLCISQRVQEQQFKQKQEADECKANSEADSCIAHTKPSQAAPDGSSLCTYTNLCKRAHTPTRI